MRTLLSTSIRITILCALLGLLSACGDEPQRIGKSEPVASPHATEHPPMNSASSAISAVLPSGAVRLAGRVQVTGSLAETQSGAVFLIARSAGRTSLVHKYEMSGSFWSKQGDGRVLHFSLTDQDNMAGAGAPVGAKLDVEARYDPDGFVDIKPGAEKKGVVKASTAASVGDTEVVLKLKSADAAPAPSASASKPSGG
jgi:hypothetical protein